MDDLLLRLDDNEELNALTLTTLLNNGAEVLLNLSPAQLIQLEKKVQKLKRQKSPAHDGLADGAHVSKAGVRKQRHASSSGAEHHIERPRPTGGQYMNLPASTPQVELRDNIEWLVFTYSTKGHVQEYHIRADIDEIAPGEIPDDFRAENCVYPRALVPREAYIGNRWEYETAVNDIAWKLCWRNPSVLCGKRGLIQRAADSYRNRTPENRSRRVMRQEKHATNSPYTRHPAGLDGAVAPAPAVRVSGPKTLTLQYVDMDGSLVKLKIRVDIEGVDLLQISEDFRANNAIFPQDLMGGPGYTAERWEFENSCNELGWKLAYLNDPKLANKPGLIAKAVEAYHTRIEAAERARQSALHQHHHHHQVVLGQPVYDPAMLYDGAHVAQAGGLLPPGLPGDGLTERNEEFSHMVAQALQQALAQGVPADAMPAGHYHSLPPVAASYHHHLPFPHPHPHAIADNDQFYNHHHIHHQIEEHGDHPLGEQAAEGESEGQGGAGLN